MLAWQAQESTSARFNPLATTHVMPGATAFNSVGVRNFVTIAQGLEASRATLELPVDTYGYDGILSSLRACAPAETTAWYVNASAWCRGCSGGAYLTALIPLVRADPAAYAAAPRESVRRVRARAALPMVRHAQSGLVSRARS